MTARDPLAKHPSPRRLRRVPQRAALWISIYLALVTAPLLLLLVGPTPPGVELWWDFSMGLGFSGLAMMGVQFALTARFRRANSPFGTDVVYVFHRYLAFVALGLVAAHFAILWFRYPETLGSLDPRVADWRLTLGRVALVCFTLAVVTSQWRKLLRIEYGLWRYAHVALAVLGLAAAAAHAFGAGRYIDTPAKGGLWLGLTLSWLLLTVWVRIVKPWRQKRRAYAVKEVRKERGDAWTLALDPVDQPLIKRFMPGQFVWLTLRTSPYQLREHPFSISSAPESLPRIELTIKALGDFTGSIKDAQAGEPAYLDGPFGVFSTDRHATAPGFVFIAGGVGITPIMSMMRSLAARGDQRPLWLFYANSAWEDVTFREEIEALGGQLALTTVHILETAPCDWDGEEGYLSEEMLAKRLPESRRGAFHYFLCGPTPMIEAAEAHLDSLSVPASQVRIEIFDLV